MRQPHFLSLLKNIQKAVSSDSPSGNKFSPKTSRPSHMIAVMPHKISGTFSLIICITKAFVTAINHTIAQTAKFTRPNSIIL